MKGHKGIYQWSSRIVYFFKKKDGDVNRHVLTTNRRPSQIPQGGLEMLTFTHKNEDTLAKVKTLEDMNYDDIIEEITAVDGDECKI